jgi:hypothetical protein
MKRGDPCGSNFPTRITEGKVSIIETEPIQSGELPAGVTDTAPVWQFVRITPAHVEFGFRSADGELQHFAWFDRASLGKLGKPCLWRSHWNFERS